MFIHSLYGRHLDHLQFEATANKAAVNICDLCVNICFQFFWVINALEGLMLKLELQYFGHLMQRTDSLEKTLMLGKIEGRKRRG